MEPELVLITFVQTDVFSFHKNAVIDIGRNFKWKFKVNTLISNLNIEMKRLLVLHLHIYTKAVERDVLNIKFTYGCAKKC